MKGRGTEEDGFEQRLLTELKSVVAERGAEQAAAGTGGGRGSARRQVPRLALAATAALVAAAAVLVLRPGGDGSSRAFAVEPQEGGGVKIEVYSLEDASGLEQALEDAGIRAQVTWLPAKTSCREPHFTPSRVKLPGGGGIGGFIASGPETLTISIGSTERSRKRFGEHRRGEISDEEYYGGIANVNLDPDTFRRDQSVVLSGAPKPFDGDPEGGYEARFAVAAGPVEPCDPLPAPASSIGAIEVSGAGGGAAPAVPTPGQFLYTKTKVVQLQGWDPEGPGAGPRDRPRYFTPNLVGPEGDALPALVPTLKEVWMTRGGKTRERETLGQIEFLSGEDQARWEAAGSPPPFAYDGAEHDVRRDGAGRLVKEYASRSWRGRHEFSYVGKLSRLPTDPEALRLAIENRRGGSAPVLPSPAGSQRGGTTAERLMEILAEPITTPALRAAALNALAEIPGIGIDRNVTDAAGRRGNAITWDRERGFGRRIIFDPRTSRILAQAEMIFDAEAAESPGVPDGTVFRETAYLRSAIVDSIDHG